MRLDFTPKRLALFLALTSSIAGLQGAATVVSNATVSAGKSIASMAVAATSRYPILKQACIPITAFAWKYAIQNMRSRYLPNLVPLASGINYLIQSCKVHGYVSNLNTRIIRMIFSTIFPKCENIQSDLKAKAVHCGLIVTSEELRYRLLFQGILLKRLSTLLKLPDSRLMSLLRVIISSVYFTSAHNDYIHKKYNKAIVSLMGMGLIYGTALEKLGISALPMLIATHFMSNFITLQKSHMTIVFT